MRLSPGQSPVRMYRSMAILVSHGCSSSSAATAGNSSMESSTRRRCGRVTSQSRRMSLGSYALPSASWSGSGILRSVIRWLRGFFAGQLLLDLLDAPEPRIEPVRGEKGGVGALLHDASLIEHDDPISLLRHAQAVGHH